MLKNVVNSVFSMGRLKALTEN